jgi:formylglycine-generating enzyme
LDRTPVTNAQFARFVAAHPEWQRNRVARVFAYEEYLRHWQSATRPDPSIGQQPVVHVSWFAATAYCESRGMRLPMWHEWEYAAAASESKSDARSDPAWRQRILAWYSQSARAALPDVGKSVPNVYGVQDLHGTVWEWVQDLSGMLVSADNREQNDPDTARFCGTGALTMEQKENYATLMRIAMLSSMQPAYTSSTMGFRCAADVTGAVP